MEFDRLSDHKPFRYPTRRSQVSRRFLRSTTTVLHGSWRLSVRPTFCTPVPRRDIDTVAALLETWHAVMIYFFFRYENSQAHVVCSQISTLRSHQVE